MTEESNALALSGGIRGDGDSGGGSRPDGGGRTGGRPGAGGRGGRRRLPPVPVKVVAVNQLAPRLTSIRVASDDAGGGDLTRFADAVPTAHIKVFLPVPGQDAPTLPITTPEGRVWPEDQPRPITRTYTPRAFDRDTGTLEIQFVLHGVGPASEWAQRASIGDRLAVGGPGGRFAAELDRPRWWIAGDESALPAIGTLLDALPASSAAEVHIEVAVAEDEIELRSRASLDVTWHLRDDEPRVWGAKLHEAAAAAALAEGTQVWVACEAAAVRRIRRLMLDEKRIPHSDLVTRGYWRVGEADHPDHDYGED